MSILFSNNAYSTLSVAIATDAQTTVTVQTGHGDRFPIVASPDVAYVTLENTAGTREVLKITARASGADAMTVVRGQEGTTATTWSIGTVIEQRLTGGVLRQFATANEALVSVTGTDTVTGTASVAISAYTTNQVFHFLASGTNTGATTLNINGLGAKAILKAGATALAAGDIISGMSVEVLYDGTQFQLLGGGQSTLGVTAGGTGRTTGTTAYALVATGTTATGAQQTLANGATTEILVGGGAAALPAWTTATGSGAPVRATSPTFVTPLLGTPTSGVLSSCTGYPQSALTGLGTGVATALAVNVGSTGAPVVLNGALGTPSSGNLSNCTGPATMIPAASTGVAGYMSGAYATKLDGIAPSATNVTNTNQLTNGAGFITLGSLSGTAPVAYSSGTISMAAATSLANGYMTSTYASKLDGIAAGATNVTNTNQLTNGAGYITSAGTSAACSGNAATATTAGACSGNAATATNATNATYGRYVYDNGAYSGGAAYREASAMYVVYAASSGSCSGNAATASACSGNTAGTAANITAYTINQSVGSSNSPSFVDVTITSDATLKMNWASFDGGLLDRLAKVKRGIYDRKDVKLRQVGVSAQSLRKAVPEMVSKVNGKYQISQSGTLALVLELAEEVRRLRELLK